MYRQMDIFDYIEGSSGGEGNPKGNNIVGLSIYKLPIMADNPVLDCTNCLCEYCANNAENPSGKTEPGEMQICCLNCDSCYEYTGRQGDGRRLRHECCAFEMSSYGAERIRKRFKRINGGVKDGDKEYVGGFE